MKTPVKLLGHPIHPMVIVFPLGLLATSLIFDILYLVLGDVTLAAVSYWLIVAGIIGGLLAAIFGLLDWTGIPANTRAKALGLWHGIGNFIVVVLFILSWLVRRDIPNYEPNTLALGLSVAAVLLATVTGWLGGELVYRLGMAVDQGANPNAPSSLSDKPARSEGERASTD